MPAPDQPEVQHPSYALAWIHESYRGHPLVVHNGVIDGYTVHLGFLPETGQGLILLMNRDLATATLMALAYSAYDHLLGLEPLDWETRLVEETLPPLQDVPAVPLDFPLSQVAGRYEHPAYGPLTVRANGDQLLMQFRTFRFTLVYQGKLGFLSQEPLLDGAADVGSILEPEARRVSKALRSVQLRCGRPGAGLHPREVGVTSPPVSEEVRVKRGS